MPVDVEQQLAVLGKFWSQTIADVEMSEIVAHDTSHAVRWMDGVEGLGGVPADQPAPIHRFTDEEVTMIDVESPRPIEQQRRRPRRLVVAALVAAAAVVAIALVAIRNDDQVSPADQPSPTVTVPPSALQTGEGSDAAATPPVPASTTELPSTTQAVAATTSTAEQPTTTTVPSVWADVLRDRGEVVQRMSPDSDLGGLSSVWDDPADATVAGVDMKRVVVDPGFGCLDDGRVGRNPRWMLQLAAKPTIARELGPGMLIAYGLVLDTNGDGVADYLIGIVNAEPYKPHFRVWMTDLRTGETDEQIGPPYGYPIEFMHPDDPLSRTEMSFNFLKKPPFLNPDTLRFYAWTAATSGDEVIARDYVPDTGWITPNPVEFSCTPGEPPPTT